MSLSWIEEKDRNARGYGTSDGAHAVKWDTYIKAQADSALS